MLEKNANRVPNAVVDGKCRRRCAPAACDFHLSLITHPEDGGWGDWRARPLFCPAQQAANRFSRVQIGRWKNICRTQQRKVLVMDLDGLFGKTIWIRLTKDADGFVSTVGYGPLFRRSTTWMMETGDEVDWGAIVDDASYSDE